MEEGTAGTLVEERNVRGLLGRPARRPRIRATAEQVDQDVGYLCVAGSRLYNVAVSSPDVDRWADNCIAILRFRG